MSTRLMIIDDDCETLELLAKYFHQYGYHVTTASTAVGALATLRSLQPDLLILDVMLPELDGLEFCRQARQITDVPIIMLSALSHSSEKIIGLESGADDYMGKPFEPRELLARVQSILKRRTVSGIHFSQMQFGNLEINLRRRSVSAKGQEIDLSSTEFEAFLFLAQHPGQIVSRDELLEHLRGASCEVYSRTIDTLVSRIRTKLQDSAQEPKFIKTARGNGYVFIAQNELS